MGLETIFQSAIFTEFLYPFLLIFFITFAVLEKTKVLGDGKKQLNALISFIIGLVFISAVVPKLVIGDLILFLSVGVVIIFVIMLLWGFVGGKMELGKAGPFIGIAIAIIVILVALGSAGFLGPMGSALGVFWNWLFYNSWSETFWQNAFFVIIIGAALAVVLKAKGSS